MKILILGAGKMGVWLSDALCLQHEVAVFDRDISRLRYVFNTIRLTKLEEITDFEPELLINAVNLQHTQKAFEDVEAFLPEKCIIADIASVKNGLKKYYSGLSRPFVSVHPMFGPTFASLNNLSNHHAIIISESCESGKHFFRSFFTSLGVHLHDYTFEEHDQTIAYSLSVPFASTLVFGANMKHQKAPGTTFEKHLNIARGLLSEDDHLLAEILFNKYTAPQLKQIHSSLAALITIVEQRDTAEMQAFLQQVRLNLSEG